MGCSVFTSGRWAQNLVEPVRIFIGGYRSRFYVLAGTVQFFDGANWLDGMVGDFVHVPPGGVHGFRNESGAPASMLIHFSPGAPRETYFNGLDCLAEMSAEAREAFFVEHDNLYLSS